MKDVNVHTVKQVRIWLDRKTSSVDGYGNPLPLEPDITYHHPSPANSEMRMYCSIPRDKSVVSVDVFDASPLGLRRLLDVHWVLEDVCYIEWDIGTWEPALGCWLVNRTGYVLGGRS